jgi:hypothetical protein
MMATRQTIGRKIAQATALAGLLDIAAAALLAARAGRKPAAMLRGVASGPFPAALHWGQKGAALGLVVHFAIMAVMATGFMLAWKSLRIVRRRPLVAGALYGVCLWGVMYWLVLPQRWPSLYPDRHPVHIATQLLCHIVLVGLPMGFVAGRKR